MATKKSNQTTRTKRSSSTSAGSNKRPSGSGSRKKKSTSSKTQTSNKTRKLTAPEKVPGTKTKSSGTSAAAEALVWIMLAFCIILFLSNVFHLGGVFGSSVSYFFFGLFGVIGYGIPFVLFILTAFAVANHHNRGVWSKIFLSFLLIMTLSCFCELCVTQFDSSQSLAKYFETGGELRSGGGLFGGMLCMLFCPIVGTVGAWICNIVLFFITLITLTGQSAFDGLYESGKRRVGDVRETSSIRKELVRQKRKRSRLEKQLHNAELQEKVAAIVAENEGLQLEIKEPRRKRVVSGVSMDTRIVPPEEITDDMHEVVPKPASKKTSAAELSETVKKTSAAEQSEADKNTSATEQPEPVKKTSSTEHTESRARRMVDTIDHEKPAPQMGMEFTIHRNGTSQKVVSDFTSGHRQEAEHANILPDFLTERMGKTATPSRISDPALSASPVTGPDPETDPLPEVRIVEEPVPQPAAKEMTDKPRAPKPKQPKSSVEEQNEAVESVEQEILMNQVEKKREYVFPPVSLLSKPSHKNSGNSDDEVKETAAKLQSTLQSFGVNVTITNVSCGPSVTRYELMPEQGVKVSKIVSLSDDIKLNLAASDIRIEAPIPGKSAVGIEVPNKEKSAVYLRELIDSPEFEHAESKISFAVGKDIAGNPVITDLAKMPHLLIAGATGSGKSVCINTLIMSILYKASPEDVKLIMIDPKVVELSVYNSIPHLFIPVVTDPKKASGALNWAVSEMTKRYELFARYGVRNLKGYNKKVEALDDVEDADKPKKLPLIVIIVDELADLMMVAPSEVEDAIIRLTQLARAAGIHLIIATQRPSVNVITGLIKANMPSRIAFAVSSGVDSRTILDTVGAEKLLGKGDMLFHPSGSSDAVRLQGAFVSDSEVSDVVEQIAELNDTAGYQSEISANSKQIEAVSPSSSGAGDGSSDYDTYFADAGKFIIEKDKASIGMLQRVFKIGFNRAARIMDQLSEAGVVGPEEGTKPRKVLMSMEEFELFVDEYV